MKKLKKYIQEREFLKFFLMFFSGTLFAQFISIAISPILTRLYTPEDFGIYGVYLSIVSLLIVFVTGRYEFAINTAEKEKDAYSLYKIVNYLTVFGSGFIFVIIFIAGDSIIDLFNLNINKSIMYLIPVTLLLLGLLQSTTYYLNRQKNFNILTKSKIYQSFANAISSVTMGLLNFGAKGLIIANIFSVFISQLFQRAKGIKGKKNKASSDDLKNNLKKYKKYPLYNAPSAFFDNLALQAPVFILLKYFNEATVGFYNIAVRILALPLTLISTSISQVFLSQVSELHRQNKEYKYLIKKTAKYLAVIGIIPTIIIIIFAPTLFGVVFGHQWRIAGEYSQILMISYYFKFIVAPLSMVFFINQRIKLLSILQILRAVSTIIILIIFAKKFEIEGVLIAYTIHETIFYMIYYHYIIKTSK